jgi:hypothetical protein
MTLFRPPVVAVMVGLAMLAGCAAPGDWRSASREPVGLAPDPARTPEAVVQVYAARTWGWRGAFGVHTWIAVKRSRAPAYTVYEVIGWRLRWTDSALQVSERAPDARWFGNAPDVVAERRGSGVDELITRIDRAARAYPYASEYSVWPGPNSNTFTAFVARAVPELEVDLPPTAIGKDYLGERLVARTPGGGYQISLGGVFGVMASRVEGLEVNLLGLTFGIDPFSPALKLPLVGRVGAARRNGGLSKRF